MVASLKFESAAGTATAVLDQVKIIILEDGTGNKYTLDTTANNLKVAYTPNGGNAKEYTVDGLAAALGKLLTIDGSTAGKSVLAEEVAKKPVVEALIPELAKDDGTTGIYTKKGVDNELAKKADTSAIPAAPDLSNYLETSKLAEEVVKKPVVEAIFDAQDLTDPVNPINFAETKIGATFAKKTDLDNKADANGTNLDDAKVTAILEKLTDKVVKTSELSAKAADKAVVEAIFDAKDLTDPANPINFAETKIGATFAKKTDLDNKADANGTNLDDAKVTAILEKLTDKVVKTSELSAKAADKAVVEAIFDAQDLTDLANPINVAETKIGATFAKIDGSNVEEAGIIAMLGKLTPANQVAKIDGSNVEEAGVNTMLGKLTDKVVKTSELSAKAADKAVVEAIFDAQDLTDPANPINFAETKIGATFAKKTDLDNKADKSYVNTELANKADTSALADKADKSELAKKADTTALDNKADKSYVNTELAKKANTADVYTKAEAENTFLKTTELKTKAAEKAVVEAIFDAKDGQKSILVEKLGLLLDSTETPYGAQSNQVAKTFLADKGLKPTPEDVATKLIENPSFQASAKIAVNAQDSEFQEAVKAVMSQPSFEIPTDSNSPLSWGW